MEVLLSTTTNYNNKMILNFAIGKAMADIKCDKEAFQYFEEGNRLKRATLDFDIADTAKTYKKFQKTFNKSFFELRSDYGCKDKTPIFILGMPRSGSTLKCCIDPKIKKSLVFLKDIRKAHIKSFVD
jgi:hypothetical protein